MIGETPFETMKPFQARKKASPLRTYGLRKFEAGSDECFMRSALSEAERAAREGEVPVGAVIVQQGKILRLKPSGFVSTKSSFA